MMVVRVWETLCRFIGLCAAAYGWLSMAGCYVASLDFYDDFEESSFNWLAFNCYFYSRCRLCSMLVYVLCFGQLHMLCMLVLRMVCHS